MERYVAAVATMAGADLCLTGGAVHVWRLALDELPVGTSLHLVSPDEQERAGRLRFERDRSAFLTSRAGLRAILGRYLDMDPAAVTFASGRRGKPSIVGGGDLSFSLSRSAPVGVVAVTRGQAVGVDVERIRPDVDIDALAFHFLSPTEAEALRAAPEPDRLAAFFACWTGKEAMVKVTGAGLGDGLLHVEADLDDKGPLTVRSVDAGPAAAAAVAVEGPMGPITVSDLEPQRAGSSR